MKRRPPDRTHAPGRAELIVPVISSAYALYYLYSVSEFPFEAQISGFFLAGLLLTLCSSFFIRRALRARTGRRPPVPGTASLMQRRPAMLLAATLAYIILLPWLGFTLATFAFLATAFGMLGMRPLRRAVFAAGGAALGGWAFFVLLLDTRFPAGPFEALMAALR